MMRTQSHCNFLVLLITISIIYLATTANAQDAQLDAPHNSEFASGCTSCHDISAFDQPNMIPDIGWTPGNIDDTQYNNICWGCHNGTDATAVDTHSSLTTSNKYGNWSVGCSVCHNQHSQDNPGGKFIRNRVQLPKINISPPKTGTKIVVFNGPTGPNSFADGDPAAIDGICEVCHTQTTHWRNDGTLANVGVHDGLGGSNCMGCHVHGDGFRADCSSCHDFPPGALVSVPGTTGSAIAGAHIEHYTNQNISCDSCHFENFTNGEHNNGGSLSITIGFGPTAPIPQGGDYDGQGGLVAYDRTTTVPATNITNTGSKTCSILYCHGNYPGSGLVASPVWDVPATGDCGTCHNASNSENLFPASGSHERHAEDGNIAGNPSGAFQYNRGYECSLCHNGIVSGTGPASYTIADKAKHVNGTVDWAFDTSDSRLTADAVYNTATGTEVPSDGIGPNRSYNTCNNLYCHSIVQTDTGGALTANTADYKTPTWGGTVICGDCHNADQSHEGPASSLMDSGSHSEHLAYDFTTSFPANKCNLCHEYAAIPPTAVDCSSCHFAGERTDHADGEVDVKFDASFTAGGTYDGTPAPGDGFGTCASTYCHSEGTTSTPASFTTNSDPTWDVPFAGNCIDCHDNDFNSGSIMATGSHQKHLNYKYTVGGTDLEQFTCNQCHLATVSDNRTIADKTVHVNKLVNVAFDPATVLPGGATATYTGTNTPLAKAPGSAAGDCSNTYCHSQGTTLTPPYPAPSYTPVTWGGTLRRPDPWSTVDNYTCDSCHGSSNSYTNIIATNAHTAHVNNTGINKASLGAWRIGCSGCHDATGRHNEIENLANHIDRKVSIQFWSGWTNVEDTDLPTFAGNPTQTANGAPNGSEVDPGAFSAECSNVYCHGVGNLADNSGSGAVVPVDHDNNTGTAAVDYKSVAWNATSTGCNFCHGDPNSTKVHPIYPSGAAGSNTANSHVAHIEGDQAGGGKNCAYCHYSTDLDTSIPPTFYDGDHIDRVEDVTIQALAATTPDAYEAEGAKTCTAVYCHSDGTAVSTGTLVNADTIVWGGANMTCNSCHNTDAGSHNGPDYADGTAKENSHDDHTAYGCNTCHFSTTSDGTNVTNGSLHANGAYDVTPNAGAGVTFTYTYVAAGQSTCSTVSCHGGTFTAYWGKDEHNVSYNAAVDLSQVSMAGDNPCADCHTNDDDGDTTPLNSWMDIMGEHETGCVRCHEYTDDGDATPTEAEVTAAITGGGPATCVTCHSKKLDPAPASDHGGHPFDFGSTASCLDCHNLGAGWVVDIHNSNDCNICHSGGYSANTERVGVNGDGDATAANGTAAGDPGDGSVWGAVTCVTCHNVADTDVTATTVGGIHHEAEGNVVYNPNTCSACHSVAGHEGDHTSLIQSAANSCATCHTNTPGGGTGTGAPVAPGDDKVHDACTDCHGFAATPGANGVLLSLATADTQNPDIVTAMPNPSDPPYNNGGGLCTACHTQYFNEHNHVHQLTAAPACASCHDNGIRTDTNAGDAITAPFVGASEVHAGGCATCHDLDATPTGVLIGSAVGAAATASCIDCHIKVATPDWIAVHENDLGTGAGKIDHSDADTLVANHANCSGCHANVAGSDGRNAITTPFYSSTLVNGKTEVHAAAGCATCHTGANNGNLRSSGLTKADTVAPGNCTTCHTSSSTWTSIHDTATGAIPAVSHATRVASLATCTTCHTATTGGTGGVIPFNAASSRTGDMVHDGCADCHTATGTLQAPYGYASAISAGNCGTCHTSTYFDNHVHGTDAGYISHTVAYNASVDLSQVSMPGDNPCADCHTDNSDGSGTPLNSWTDILGEHLTDCATCHSYTDADSDGTPPLATHNGRIGARAASTCVSCHTPKLDPDPLSDHGGHAADFGSDASCTPCHDLGTGWVVDIHNNNDCSLCHNGAYNAGTEKLGDSITGKSPAGDARFADGAAAGGTWGTFTCTSCHGTVDSDTNPMYFHGITIATAQAVHNLSSDSTGGYDCEACHSGDVTNEQLNTHMASDTVAQCTTVCHLNTTPSDTSGIVAKTIIDNVTFNDPEPNLNDSKCENCHAAKDDFSRHGLTDDDSVSDGIGDGTGGVVFHDNLGNSTGVAPTFTGKLTPASYDGILANEYNCGQCHSADPDNLDGSNNPNISSLEAMQLHTIANGTGHGDCLTCHVHATSVADEIASGTTVGGGTTQYCENCHASANGNGPSGKAMYQYDGVRHHTLAQAQRGDCTWCHADPRVSIPIQATGFATTAAANASDAGVGSSVTGWNGSDYGLNQSTMTDANIPKQPGCRYCHTNAISYSINVEGGNGNHGYNIGGPTDGLTVYANDFYGGEVTIPNNNNAAVTADPVTQTEVHRIESNDGTSLIEVENMGSCFSCHSVQVFHAAPQAGTDYITPDTCNINSVPFDTLRYGPGRSIFNYGEGLGNDGYYLRGANTNNDNWDQHRKNSNGTEWARGCSQAARDRTDRGYINGGNPPLIEWGTGVPNEIDITFPAHSSFNNFETLGGTFRGPVPTNGNTFTTFGFPNNSVTMPTLNGVTVAVAEWQGGTNVYVEAYTDSGDCADTLAFNSYTPGGCTSGNLACAAGKYTGTCTDASGWTAGDIITIRNTTTASDLDVDSRVVIDNSGPAAAAGVADTLSASDLATGPATVLDVLANDSGTELRVVAVSSVTTVSGTCGTIAITGGGTTVTYTATANGNAQCTFTYDVQAHDGHPTTFGPADTGVAVTVNQSAVTDTIVAAIARFNAGGNTCDIDPLGTYIEAENYNPPIGGGTYAWSVSSDTTGTKNGFAGTGYLHTTTGGTNATPNGGQTDYDVFFPTTGTYRIWMRVQDGGWNGGAGDSTFFGIDGTYVGTLTELGTNQWEWTNNQHADANTFTIATAGAHTINLWPREADQLTDGFIIVLDSNPDPVTEGSTAGVPGGITTVDPTNCVVSSGTLDVLAINTAGALAQVDVDYSAAGAEDTLNLTHVSGNQHSVTGGTLSGGTGYYAQAKVYSDYDATGITINVANGGPALAWDVVSVNGSWDGTDTVITATNTWDNAAQLYADYNGSGPQAMTWTGSDWTYTFSSVPYVATVDVTSNAAGTNDIGAAVTDASAPPTITRIDPVTGSTEWIEGSAADSGTFDYEIGTCDNRALIVMIGSNDGGFTDTNGVASATYDGIGLTRITDYTTASRTDVWIGYLNEEDIASTTGTQVAWNNNQTGWEDNWVHVMTFCGVKQGAPGSGQIMVADSEGIGTTSNVTTITSKSYTWSQHDMVVYAAMNQSGSTHSTPTGFTQFRMSGETSGGNNGSMSSGFRNDTDTSGGTGTITVNFGTSDRVNISSFVLTAAVN